MFKVIRTIKTDTAEYPTNCRTFLRDTLGRLHRSQPTRPPYGGIRAGRADTSSFLRAATCHNEFRFSANNCWRQRGIESEKQCTTSLQNGMTVRRCPRRHTAPQHTFRVRLKTVHRALQETPIGPGGCTRIPDEGSPLWRKATTPTGPGFPWPEGDLTGNRPHQLPREGRFRWKSGSSQGRI